jgi:hypothetical protein
MHESPRDKPKPDGTDGERSPLGGKARRPVRRDVIEGEKGHDHGANGHHGVAQQTGPSVPDLRDTSHVFASSICLGCLVQQPKTVPQSREWRGDTIFPLCWPLPLRSSGAARLDRGDIVAGRRDPEPEHLFVLQQNLELSDACRPLGGRTVGLVPLGPQLNRNRGSTQYRAQYHDERWIHGEIKDPADAPHYD